MEMKLANKLQCHIADLMWNAESESQILEIRKVYGKDADVVFHMLVAAYFDEDMSVDISEPIINMIIKNNYD